MAAQVAASSSSVGPERGTVSLPAADQCFFAPCSSPLQHQHDLCIATTGPDIAASVLREVNCPLPLEFTATVNARGSLPLTSTSSYTPATAFTPFYEARTNNLNQSFTIGDTPFLPFQPAPNEVQMAIHVLPYGFMPTVAEDSLPALAELIQNATSVEIYSAGFLQSDPAKRAQKSSGSVVVSVSLSDVPAFRCSIRLFSRSGQVQCAYSSNPMT